MWLSLPSPRVTNWSENAYPWDKFPRIGIPTHPNLTKLDSIQKSPILPISSDLPHMTTWSPSLNSLSLETNSSHLKFQQCHSMGFWQVSRAFHVKQWYLLVGNWRSPTQEGLRKGVYEWRVWVHWFELLDHGPPHYERKLCHTWQSNWACAIMQPMGAAAPVRESRKKEAAWTHGQDGN